MEEIGLFELDLAVDDRNPAGDVITVGKDSIYGNVDAFRKRDAISTEGVYAIIFNSVCAGGQAVTNSRKSIKRPYSTTTRLDFSNGRFACATGFGRTQLIFIPGPVLPNLSLHPSSPFVNIIVDVYYPAGEPGPSVEIDGHASPKWASIAVFKRS
jgi:hypothetical protein